jgi:general secretion pathway protein G
MSGRLLAIVIGIIMLLGAAYATRIIRHEKTAHFQRAAELRDDLKAMRNAIAAYHRAEGRYPRTLQELVPKYLPTVPVDPVTDSKTTWRVVTEETVQPSSDFSTAAPPKNETYVIDVHSGASGKDATGVPFATY